MDVVVAYDIADTEGQGAARLRNVASICERYGERVQYSVFECRLSRTRFAQMENELRDAMDKNQDCIFIYRFPGCIEDWKMLLGKANERKIGQPWII